MYLLNLGNFEIASIESYFLQNCLMTNYLLIFRNLFFLYHMIFKKNYLNESYWLHIWDLFRQSMLKKDYHRSFYLLSYFNNLFNPNYLLKAKKLKWHTALQSGQVISMNTDIWNSFNQLIVAFIILDKIF